jgi:hypothetical protein
MREAPRQPKGTPLTDEPAPTQPVTENMPASAGQISALASANAPFIFFDSASFYGWSQGNIAQLTLDATRLMAAGPDGRVAIDRVVVCHLRCGLPALLGLRAAIDAIIAMAQQPKPEGPAAEGPSLQ